VQASFLFLTFPSFLPPMGFGVAAGGSADALSEKPDGQDETMLGGREIRMWSVIRRRIGLGLGCPPKFTLPKPVFA